MIIIFSKRSDQFVDDVVELLPSDKFIRIDNYSIFDCIEYRVNGKKNSFVIKNKDITIDLSKIHAIWFCGGTFNLQNVKDSITNQQSVFNEIKKSIDLLLTKNLKMIIGRPIEKISNNKISELISAKKSGFIIPDFLVTTEKSSLLEFMFNNRINHLICKKLSSEDIVESEHSIYHDISKTILLDKIMIERIPSKFGLSFFQKKIDRKYEVRVIYFKGNFYSAAIFPQTDSIDYRKDFHTINAPRIVPYKLPSSIENKIDKLMNSLKYDTGSIDLIFNKNSEYVFLEINPYGHMSFINNECNFYMQKEFADFLIKAENEEYKLFG